MLAVPRPIGAISPSGGPVGLEPTTYGLHIWLFAVSSKLEGVRRTEVRRSETSRDLKVEETRASEWPVMASSRFGKPHWRSPQQMGRTGAADRKRTLLWHTRRRRRVAATCAVCAAFLRMRDTSPTSYCLLRGAPWDVFWTFTKKPSDILPLA